MSRYSHDKVLKKVKNILVHMFVYLYAVVYSISTCCRKRSEVCIRYPETGEFKGFEPPTFSRLKSFI